MADRSKHHFEVHISLKKNVAATYGSQLFTAAAGIILLPLYVEALGAEAYGIVAFGVALQTWITLLDLGLSATLSREASRFVGGAVAADELRGIWRLVQRTFFALSAGVALSLLLFAGPIAAGWLDNEALADGEVIVALRLLGGLIGLRLLFVPYRAFLTGFEDLQWLAGVTILFTLIRAVLVLPVMALTSADLLVFFGWQVATCLVEWLLYWSRVRRRLPPAAAPTGPVGALLRRHWRFSLAIAVTSGLGVAVSNLDKLILSGLLTLADYGLFMLPVAAATGVLMLTGPISTSFGPRLTAVFARGDEKELTRIYALQAELIVVIAVPAVLVLALFAEQTMFAWTGNPAIAERAAPILAIYCVANGIQALLGLPYQLQVAAGKLRLHVIGIFPFVGTYLPLLAIGLDRFGMIGAALAWLVPNLLYFLLYVPLIHRRYLPEPHFRWLARLLLTAMPAAAGGLLLAWLMPWSGDRWLILLQLLSVGAALLLLSAAGSPALRQVVAANLHNLREKRR